MQQPKPLLGIGLMLMAMAILPFMDVFAKYLGQAGVPILLVVWGRALFSAAVSLPFAFAAAGRASLRPAQPLHHLCRAGLLFAATWFFFTSLKYLPIADALAIFFVNPLIVTLFSADGPDAALVMRAADELRHEAVGDTVSYVVNRNINYTNICLYRCSFCAFSKGGNRALRGPAYLIDEDEIAARTVEAAARGATFCRSFR